MLEPLLEIADSSMTYRRRYFARPQLSPVLDLLLLGRHQHPRLGVSAGAVSEHIRHLPRDPNAPSPTREERLIDQAHVRRCGRWISSRSVRDGTERARR